MENNALLGTILLGVIACQSKAVYFQRRKNVLSLTQVSTQTNKIKCLICELISSVNGTWKLKISSLWDWEAFLGHFFLKFYWFCDFCLVFFLGLYSFIHNILLKIRRGVCKRSFWQNVSQLTHFGFLGFLIFYWSLWGSLYFFFLLSFFCLLLLTLIHTKFLTQS